MCDASVRPSKGPTGTTHFSNSHKHSSLLGAADAVRYANIPLPMLFTPDRLRFRAGHTRGLPNLTRNLGFSRMEVILQSGPPLSEIVYEN